MRPHISPEVVSEAHPVKTHQAPYRRRSPTSTAHSSTYDRARHGIIQGAAPLAAQFINKKRTVTPQQLQSLKLGLWSTQRYTVLLVTIDVAIGLVVLFVTAPWPPISAPPEANLLPLWLMVWMASSGMAGAYAPLASFSSRRMITTSINLSLRSGIAALAASSLIAAFLGTGVRDAGFIQVIILLTLASGLARIVTTRVSPARIIVVTRENEPLPGDYLPGPAVGHLQLTEAQIAEPQVVIGEISEKARNFDACAIEVVGDIDLPESTWRSLSWELRNQHISLRFPLAGGPLRQHRVHCAVRRGRAVIEISAPVRPLSTRLAKRTTDIIGALVLLIVFFPLLVLLACAVKITSRGPVFYKQERVGYNGRSFQILKFRTMVDGSDAQLQDLLKAQKRGDTPLFKVADDPRITPLGAILRRYSLDELPQLINVLNGSMSLVGPRPQRPAEVALYSGIAGHRLGVRPGMTGLWQVNGRSRLSWEEGQQMDIDYAHNWSFWEDMHILVRTARAVVASDGAV